MLSLIGAALLMGGLLTVGGATAPAAAAPVTQCNGVGADGEGYNCDVTITNTLDMATGVGSSTVRTVICNGAANTAFTAGDCTDSGILAFAELTPTVDQCNGTVEGGGSSMHCTVTMTNTIIGTTTPTIASVNQCNGSFDSLDPLPDPSFCDPVEATTNATVTQCNDSMNGGTNVSMQCTVGESTVSSALPVSVDQCNNSVNGGGGTMSCSTTITTIVQAAADDGGDDGSDGGGTDGGATDGGGGGTDGGGTGDDGTAGGGTPSGGGTATGEELAATGSADTAMLGLAAALLVLLGGVLAVGSRKAART